MLTKDVPLIFPDLSSCLERLASVYATEYVWVSADLVFCDPRPNRNESWRHDLPEDHRFRICLRKHRGGWEQAVPRYLYRGEADRFARTSSGLIRLLDDEELGRQKLTSEDRHIIQSVLWRVEQELAKFPGMSSQFAEGCCQHYGFATPIIDFTSDLEVAAYFAISSHAEHLPKLGFIAILDFKIASEYCGLVDLTKHPYAIRPQAQSAYGLRQEFFTSLKDPEAVSSLGITWYAFERHPEDSRLRQLAKFTDGTRPLLDASRDVMAGLVNRYVGDHIRSQGPISFPAAAWLARRLPPTKMTKRGARSGQTELVTWLRRVSNTRKKKS